MDDAERRIASVKAAYYQLLGILADGAALQPPAPLMTMTIPEAARAGKLDGANFYELGGTFKVNTGDGIATMDMAEIRAHPGLIDSEGFVRGGKASPSVRKILAAIANAYPTSLSFKAAAKRAGISMRSSGVPKYEREVLASPDVINRDGRLTWAHKPANFVEMANPIDTFAANLPPAYAKMLRVLAGGQQPLSRHEVATLSGLSVTSSGIGAGLKELLALELVEKLPDGRFRLSADFRS